jgi:hypothetical protein
MNPVIDVFGVNIAEPMTMLTDYLIFAASSWFAVTLFNAAEHRGQSCRKLWASAFLIIGIGALLGGTSHGFSPHLDDTAMYWIWKGTGHAEGASPPRNLSGTRTVYAGNAGKQVQRRTSPKGKARLRVKLSGHPTAREVRSTRPQATEETS